MKVHFFLEKNTDIYVKFTGTHRFLLNENNFVAAQQQLSADAPICLLIQFLFHFNHHLNDFDCIRCLGWTLATLVFRPSNHPLVNAPAESDILYVYSYWFNQHIARAVCAYLLNGESRPMIKGVQGPPPIILGPQRWKQTFRTLSGIQSVLRI